MARTRTTIRRIDPWSVLKFAFVTHLLMLGIALLVGAIVFAMIRRLELIETVCGMAANFSIRDCGVDGGALFDAALVLGLLAVVILTGIAVFMAFLANLIFDLIGGIGVTLDDGDLANPGVTRGISAGGTRAAAKSGPGLMSKLGDKVQEAKEKAAAAAASDDGKKTDAKDSGSKKKADAAGASSKPAGSTKAGGDDDRLFGGS